MTEAIDRFFKGALSLEEAAAAVDPVSVMPYAEPEIFKPLRDKPYTRIAPVKVFDNVWWTGTDLVGSFVIDTGDGLVMIDCGWGEFDCSVMVRGMKDMGLDPSAIRAVIVSHEHGDHYGGVNYLLKEVCPDAEILFGLAGWNFLQTVPTEFAYTLPRPKKADVYLTDGEKFRIGGYPFMSVLTPGHSPGCLSLIFPVRYRGEWIMAGLMGGSGIWPDMTSIRQYACSIEYFKRFTDAAGCEAGLAVHQQAESIEKVRRATCREDHPWIYGKEGFDREYLGGYRNRVRTALKCEDVPPYMMGISPVTGRAVPERFED
ncbi:MAG: MBL fold metallo-hydrolase [Firmicutes bacterium]|nr:MBL fold metallo-hydrolase [Bacillota bacterium]